MWVPNSAVPKIAYDQRVGVEPVRRERAELVLPQANDPTRPHLVRNDAERGDRVPVSAAVGFARSGIVFRVDNPDFPEGQSCQL